MSQRNLFRFVCYKCGPDAPRPVIFCYTASNIRCRGASPNFCRFVEHRCQSSIFFYVLTLPIGFVAYFEFWAIPISVFVFYVLVSLEIIAEEIEMPFGTDANDLPTQKLSDMIRRNVNEIFDA